MIAHLKCFIFAFCRSVCRKLDYSDEAGWWSAPGQCWCDVGGWRPSC